MKKINKYIPIILFSLLVSFIGCNEEPSYPDLVDLGANPTFVTQVSVGSIADVSFDITITPDIVGTAYYVVTTAGSVEDKPNYVDVIDGAVSGTLADGSINFTTTDAATITISGLSRNTSYDIFAVLTNTNGLAAQVSEKVTAKTLDTEAPSIVSLSPANYSSMVSVSEDIVITFSEAVTYVTTKELLLYSDGGDLDIVVSADDITVDGNIVTITHIDLPWDDYINLEIEEGAFVDVLGNESAAVLGYPDASSYWFKTKPEIDFNVLSGVFYVQSENEIGFGNGESGGYWVTVSKFDDYTLQIDGLRWSSATIYLSLDPTDKSISIPNQQTGLIHTSSGEDIMAYDTDPYGVGASSGYVPGTYDDVNGELNFFVWYSISLGSFGFYTYDLKLAIPPASQVIGSQDMVPQTVKQF